MTTLKPVNAYTLHPVNDHNDDIANAVEMLIKEYDDCENTKGLKHLLRDLEYVYYQDGTPDIDILTLLDSDTLYDLIHITKNALYDYGYNFLSIWD